MSIDSESGFEADSSDETRLRRDDASPSTESGFTVSVNPFDLESSATEASPIESAKPDSDAARSERFVPGRMLGDFELIQEVGRGGMGLVYEARQRSLGKRVAVKVLPSSALMDRRVVKRFQNEAWAAAQLQHRNIVPVYQVGVERGTYFYAMQFIDGLNLGELFHSLKLASQRRVHGQATKHPNSSKAPLGAIGKRNGRDDQATKQVGSSRGPTTGSSGRRDSTHRSNQSRKDTINSQQLIHVVEKNRTTSDPEFVAALTRIGIQVADALHYAHDMGIIHRDIKPSNLLMDLDGDVWVSDFGLAQIDNNTGLTATGAMVGTLRYMSPEQIVGKRLGVDHRTDIYSLGVSLYELLTLRHAFAGESREMIMRRITFDDPTAPRKIDRRIPVELETIIMKSISKNPSDRYQTADELANDLRRFRDNEPIKGRKPNVAQRLARWSSRNRPLVASLATLVLTAFLASIAVATANWKLYTTTAAALKTEETQRKEVERLLKRSEGLRLAATSRNELEENPTLGLLLGMESFKSYPGSASNSSILNAFDRQRQFRTLAAQERPVGHITFNQDGSRLISCSVNPRFGEGPAPAIIWDVNKGEIVGRLVGENSITSTVVSPDKFRLLAVSSFPLGARADQQAEDSSELSNVSMWDMVSLTELVQFSGSRLDAGHTGVFAPDGRSVVLPSRENTAIIYDSVGGHELFVLAQHTKPVVYASYSPTGEKIATYSDDNTVCIWKASDGTLIHQFSSWKERSPAAKECIIRSLSFSPDGRQLAVGAGVSTGISIWDLESGAQISSKHIDGGNARYWTSAPQWMSYRRTGAEVSIGTGTGEITIRNLVATTGAMSDAEISPDGQWIAMRGHKQAGWVSLVNSATGSLETILKGHQVMVNDIAFSPNSRLIATASSDKTIKLWHLDNGRRRSTFPTPSFSSSSQAVATSDGTRLAILSKESRSVGLLTEIAGSKSLVQVKGQIWTPETPSTHFVTTEGNRLSVYSDQNGSADSTISTPNGRFTHAAITRNGEFVAGALGHLILLWKPNEGRQVVLDRVDGRVVQLQFDPRGDRLAAAYDDGFVRLYDTTSKTRAKKLACNAVPLDLTFSRNGEHIAAVTDQNPAMVWKADTGERIATIEYVSATFSNLHFNHDATKIVAHRSSNSTVVCAWDVDSGQLVRELETTGQVSVAVHPTEDEVLIGSTEDGAFIWQFVDNVRKPLTGESTASVCFSADGSELATASWMPYSSRPGLSGNPPAQFSPATLRRWSRDRLAELDSLELPSDRISDISITASGKVALNASRYCSVDIYSTADKRKVAEVPGHALQVSRCIFTSKGDRLITASWDQTVTIWETESGARLQTLQGHSAAVDCLAISKDDRTLVSGDRSGKLLVWDAGSGRLRDQFDSSFTGFRTIELSPDSEMLLALGADGTLDFRKVEDGTKIPVDPGIQKFVWAEFAPDGQSFLLVPALPRRPMPDAKHRVLIVPVDGNAVTILEFQAPVVTSHFHPTENRIITALRSGEVIIRDAKSGQVTQEFKIPGSSVLGATLNPTGKYAAVAAFDRLVIWDLAGKREWLSIPRRTTALSPQHHLSPFLAETNLVATQRPDSMEWRTWPLDPPKQIGAVLPREMTQRERERFWIEK